MSTSKKQSPIRQQPAQGAGCPAPDIADLGARGPTEETP